MANNHGIHHRGQLMSYLRAMGSKVPPIYGASADEPFNRQIERGIDELTNLRIDELEGPSSVKSANQFVNP